MRRPRLHVRVPLLGAVGLCAATAGAASAQEARTSERTAFLDAAAEAAARYADVGEAMADGFRRLGPDFPGMGSHWVQPGRIVSGVLDGDRPAVLCYVQLDGETTLVGLAYALPLGPDESPPEEPFGTAVWHDHAGEVSEESLLLEHPASFMSHDETDFRLSMVHVWLPLTNPDGILEQNNWRLPFLRAGLEPPERPSSLAARGLSLGSTGVAYYRELLHWAAGGDEDRDAIDRVLARRGAEVSAWLEGRHALGAEELAELERFWRGLWDDLEASLSPETFERVRPLRAGS